MNVWIQFDLSNGVSYNFDDLVVPGSGTTALNQFLAKQTIHSVEDDQNHEVIIPFHSIQFVTSGREDFGVHGKDDVCPTESCDFEWQYTLDGTTWNPLEVGGEVAIVHPRTMAGIMAMGDGSPATPTDIVGDEVLENNASYEFDPETQAVIVQNQNHTGDGLTGSLTIKIGSCSTTFTIILGPSAG